MSPAHSRMEVNDRAQKLADLEDKHEHHTLAKFTETKSALEVGNCFFQTEALKKDGTTRGCVTFACTSKVAGQRKQQLALEVGEARKMKAESIFFAVKETWECRADHEYWISHDIIIEANEPDDFPMIFF